LIERARSPGTWLFVGALVVGSALVASISLLHTRGLLHAYVLFGDVRGMVELPVHAGWLSDAGVLLWWSSASVAMFVVLQCRARGRGRGHGPGHGREPGAGRLIACLFTAAAITAWLALDDALLLHERVLPMALGVGQRAIYVAYAAAVALWLVWFRRELLTFRPVRLGVALALFALSVALDALPDALRPFGEARVLYEDGAKLLGIIAWSLWLWGAAFDASARAR